MSKILVKASPQIQIGPDGKPQMFYNVGFGGRRGGVDGARGRTMRNIIGRYGGGALGTLGGLAGESRSLGGFLSNVQVGAMQGAAAGGGLADFLTSRNRQKRADIREGEKQAKLQADVEAQLRGERELKRRRNVMRDTGVYEYQEGEPVSPTSRLGPRFSRGLNRGILGRLGGRDMRQFGHDLAAFQSEQEAAAAEQAKQEKLRARGRRRDDDPAVQAVRNIDPERLRAAQQVLANAGIQAPQQQPQAPQQIVPLSQETQNQITQGDTQPPVDAPFADHDSEQNSAGQVGEGEMPESEGGEPSEPTSTRMGRLGDREQDLFNQFMQQRGGGQ